ncbi:MAG: hypothetical protein CMK74_03585 [Pseudomonadales bacterium]|nr:hypothetical protein [Pseudomonadales bacterium]
MESVELLPLKILSGNLLGLIQFYFLSWSTFHSSMREAAIPVIFGGGLVWTVLIAVKFPEDKFKGVVGTFVILVVTGILIAPSKDASVMIPRNAQAPTPVANGSVWTFQLAGNVYQLFRSSTDSVFKNTLQGEATGGESFRTAKHAILYDDAAENVAAELKTSPGFELVTAYMGLCNKAIEDVFNDSGKLAAAHGVGLAGSNLIGVNSSDRSVLSAAREGLMDSYGAFYSQLADKLWRPDLAYGALGSAVTNRVYSAYVVDDMVEDGLELLDSIPEHKNPFAGGTTYGFLVPTKAYFDSAKTGVTTGKELLDPRTFEGGKYVHGAIANGTELSPDQAYMFYPKTCREAYELSNLALRASLDSSNDNSALNDPIYLAKNNLTAQARIGEMANNASIEYMKDLGLDPSEQQVTALENISDNAMGGLIAVSAEIGEFMLRYKIPMMVSVSAMLAAALLVTFPLFAVMSVFLGPQILITFFKLVIFAFLLIYLNDLFVSMSAEILYFQEISSAQGFNTGLSAGMTATQAASTTKAIIFSTLTVVEVAAARLILWDDAKALAGFKPGSIGTDRAASMAKSIGALVFTAMTLGKGGAVLSKAVAAKGAASASQTASTQMTAVRTMSASASAVARGSTQGGQNQSGRPMPMKGSLNPPTPPKPTS